MAPKDGQTFLRWHNFVLQLHNVSWWVALAGVLVALANVLFGLNLDPKAFQMVVELIGSLVVGTAIAVHGHASAAAAAIQSSAAPAAAAPAPGSASSPTSAARPSAGS